MANKIRQWKIYWNEYVNETYLYGTEIDFHAKDDVEFKNLLMPPGTIIKKWYSRVNFQAGRVEPTLPIIDGEGHYHISVNVESDVKEGIFLRLLFLDKNGEEAGSLFVDKPEMEFTCPKKTNSYEAQLICAGAHSLHFHSFTISERME